MFVTESVGVTLGLALNPVECRRVWHFAPKDLHVFPEALIYEMFGAMMNFSKA